MDESGLGKYILDKLEKLDDKLDQVRVDQEGARKAFDAHEKKDDERHQEIKKMTDKVLFYIDKNSVRLDTYNSQLEEHIRRTNLLEQRTDWLEDRQSIIKENIKPIIKEHEKKKIIEENTNKGISKTTKVLALIGATITVITGTLKLLGYF